MQPLVNAHDSACPKCGASSDSSSKTCSSCGAVRPTSPL
jgi:ribosomal protein L37E